MSTSFWPDLLASNVYADAPPQKIRDARYEEMYKDIKGKVIKYGSENEMISPKTPIKHSLLKWQNHALNDSMNHNRGDTFLPLSDARKDMAAYCYSHHMNGGCNQIDDDF